VCSWSWNGHCVMARIWALCRPPRASLPNHSANSSSGMIVTCLEHGSYMRCPLDRGSVLNQSWTSQGMHGVHFIMAYSALSRTYPEGGWR
jgi:hypothetical protein